MKLIWTFLLWVIIAPLGCFFLPESECLFFVDGFLPMATALGAALLLKNNILTILSQRQHWITASLLGLGSAFIFLFPIPLGYQMGLSAFSYGSLQDSSALFQRTFLLKIPAIAIVTGFGYEWVFRKRLLSPLVSAFGIWPALLIASLAGTAFQWPRLFMASGSDNPIYVSTGSLELLMGELICGQLVLLTGRLMPAILFHTLIRVTEMFLLGDMLNPYLPLRVFISSNPNFYWLKVAVQFSLAVGFAFWIWKQRKRKYLLHS